MADSFAAIQEHVEERGDLNWDALREAVNEDF